MKIKLFEELDFDNEPWEYEETDIKTVYIVLEYFWEGDGYLVNSYGDCFLSEQEALEYATKKAKPFPVERRPKIYKYDEVVPDESDGDYNSTPFYHIIKKEF